MDFFTDKLLKWFQQNKRTLPWRETTDPYAIWLSEVILQQTRVNQGFDYYLRMLEAFPNVYALAQATETEVLKQWQGLGYYSRARNLHQAAQQIVNELDGQLPDTYDKLLILKGIGSYTAAAIASIAFNQPVAVIDGNVSRVLTRVFGWDIPIDSSHGKKQLTLLANELMDKKQPGNFNQAIMEFGALQCVPFNPVCGSCIFVNNCIAFKENIVSKLPVKAKKVVQRDRWFHFLIISSGSANDCNILIHQRQKNDIWKSLYQFPLIETDGDATTETLADHPFFQEHTAIAPYTIAPCSAIITHQLTHQRLFCRFHHIHSKETLDCSMKNGLSLVALSKLDHYPLPRLIDRFLENGGRETIEFNIKTIQHGRIE